MPGEDPPVPHDEEPPTSERRGGDLVRRERNPRGREGAVGGEEVEGRGRRQDDRPVQRAEDPEGVGGNGELRNSVLRWVAGGEWVQTNDLYAAAGVEPAGPGSFVTFRAGAAVFPFLISIDNRSGDPTFLEPRESFQP